MSRFLDADHLGAQSGGASQGSHAAGLAAAGSEAVNSGEVVEQVADILRFAAEEHTVVGNEHMIEEHHCLVVSVHLSEVDALDVAADFEEPLVLRSSAEHVGDARCVGGDGVGKICQAAYAPGDPKYTAFDRLRATRFIEHMVRGSNWTAMALDGGGNQEASTVMARSFADFGHMKNMIKAATGIEKDPAKVDEIIDRIGEQQGRICKTNGLPLSH